jgi:hypothetical protein
MRFGLMYPKLFESEAKIFMTVLSPSRKSLLAVVVFVTIIGGILASLALVGVLPHAHAASADRENIHLDCAESPLCTEVADPASAFPGYKYVGHDEPSNLFYSNIPGSGNRMRWGLRLPTDPTPGPGNVPLSGQTFNFELHPAFWFGMAMCDTQSYPQQVSTCTPDSDSNIVDPAVSPNHPGTAFMEMQFYPPGWVTWPAGNSCDPTKWCAALNIDSLSEDPVNGTELNPTCQNQLFGGVEYINFAFITTSGAAQAPASPLLTSLASITPDPTKDLFMNSGDQLVVLMNDTPSGLHIQINDLTTHQNGSMTASASNGFAQIQKAPTGTSCTAIPYNFHPMYSTSSPQTRVIWAAHSYNIAFADEIGHFDYCSNPQDDGSCSGTEGLTPLTNSEPTDVDDNGCFPASASSLIQVPGCLGTNTGFDGVPYLNGAWPAGNTTLNPTPIQFTSPLTGTLFNQNYSQSAFENDNPRIEAADFGGLCNRTTGAGCTIVPRTDDEGRPLVDFYPYYSSTSAALSTSFCVWQIGANIPNSNLYGGDAQYGTQLFLDYLAFGGHGATLTRVNDYRQILSQNPCQASSKV